MPRRKDVWVIAAVLAAAVLLLLASRLMPRPDIDGRTADATLAPDAVEYLDATPAPDQAQDERLPDAQDEEAKPQGAAMGPMPAAQTQTVRGHVVIAVRGRQYGDPIPMDRDKIITIKQDGGEVNKVHITPQKVYMESSTCENQDCVGQGEIDVDTYATRILGTYIICLPNDVTVEMIPQA